MQLRTVKLELGKDGPILEICLGIIRVKLPKTFLVLQLIFGSSTNCTGSAFTLVFAICRFRSMCVHDQNNRSETGHINRGIHLRHPQNVKNEWKKNENMCHHTCVSETTCLCCAVLKCYPYIMLTCIWTVLECFNSAHMCIQKCFYVHMSM